MTNSMNFDVGVVLEALGNTQFLIENSKGEVVRGYLSGKMKRFKIYVNVGDNVRFVVDEYGNNNRIVTRL